MQESRIMETSDEAFALRNDPPRAKSKPDKVEQRTRQRTLFVGLDDLPGQTYLIPVSNLKDD